MWPRTCSSQIIREQHNEVGLLNAWDILIPTAVTFFFDLGLRRSTRPFFVFDGYRMMWVRQLNEDLCGSYLEYWSNQPDGNECTKCLRKNEKYLQNFILL